MDPEHEDKRIHVEIHGRSYTLRGQRGADEVRTLAAYVNERMNEVASQTNTADTTRIAVLTALNLADEIFRRGRGAPAGRSRAVAAATARRDSDLCRVLDEVLAG